MSDQIFDHASRIKNLEEQNSDQENKINLHETKINVHEKKIDGLEGRDTEQTESISDQVEEMTDHDARINNLEEGYHNYGMYFYRFIFEIVYCV